MWYGSVVALLFPFFFASVLLESIVSLSDCTGILIKLTSDYLHLYLHLILISVNFLDCKLLSSCSYLAKSCHVLIYVYLFQVANGLYYNAPMCLTILQHLGVTSEIFQAWFQMLYEVKKSGKPVHFVRCYLKLTFLFISCCLSPFTPALSTVGFVLRVLARIAIV